MIVRQYAKSVRSRLRCTKRRGARLIHPAPERTHPRISHETGNDGLARARRHHGEFIRDGLQVGARIRGNQYQHTVDPHVLKQAIQQFACQGRHEWLVRNHRVGDRHARFKYFAQCASRLRRELCLEERRSRCNQVQRQLWRPAAIGQHGKASPFGASRIAQNFQGREKLHKDMHPHRACASQGGIKRRIGLDRFIGATDLEHHDRFDAGRRAQRAHEFAAKLHVLKVQRNTVRARIRRQVLQHLR